MRGYPQFNFPAFDKAAKLGRALGWEVISPADLDRESGFHEDTATTISPEFVRACVRRDIEALLSLRTEDGDAIALLPGWHNSRGAKAELAVAMWLDLTILSAVHFSHSEA